MQEQRTAEKQQFDFWIGDWTATWGEGETGSNHIEATLDGQVILEKFDGYPANSLRGMSVSTYDVSVGKWRQTWVDNEGSYIDLTGSFSDGQMVLFNTRIVNGAAVQYRMTFYNIAPESFDWRWDRSADGHEWTMAWQIHYQRK